MSNQKDYEAVTDHTDREGNLRVPRPDRVGLKPLTVRVTPDMWRFFKKASAELEETQEQLLRTAVQLFSSKLRGMPDSEYRAVYRRIRKEAAGEN